MKNLKTFEDYSHITESAKKGLLFEVWLELSKVSKLSDVRFGKAISDYLHFVIDDKLFFDISMTDNNKTISIIVEKDGITESVGSYNADEKDLVVKIVKTVLDYTKGYEDKEEEKIIKDKFNNWFDSIDYTEADYTSFKAGYKSALKNI